MKPPNVLWPTLTKGFIKGPIRCLSLDDSEIYLPPQSGKLFIPPFTKDGKMYAVTHLQKKSPSFRLHFSPFSFHFGEFWHLQESFIENGIEMWKPGTERGIYFRTPGWRWQKPDDNSNGTPWIFSKGYFGGHLD